jgi:hypothetical protein
MKSARSQPLHAGRERVDPIEFQRKRIGVELKERSAAQEQFLDLCRVLDHPTPAEMDPAGDAFTFERGATKSIGGQGWADVWYRGHFAWEYKGPHKDLVKAYDQLLRYKDDLENPPLLIVSDLNVIEVHTNFTATVKQVYRIDLHSFADPASQDVLRKVFYEPDALRPDVTSAAVTEAAARQFGAIAQGMQAQGEDPHRVAHFLMQVLFCLFAEDVRLLPNAVFPKMVAAGVRHPDRFTQHAAELLITMNTGGSVAYEDIPRFNGGLFATVDVPGMTAHDIGILHEAVALDWSAIEPSIFGTLFERSLDPGKRAQLGAHYTGRPDIERVVDPVVTTPLRRRWEQLKAALAPLIERRNAATTAQTRRNREAEVAGRLGAFTDELAAVRILDPACGSGNFLYVALERLLDLEKEVRVYGATEAGLPMGLPSVRPRQVLGLEINDYAQQLAQVVVWIGYLQWMIGNGFTGLSEPVLDPLETIRLQDALLTTHEDGSVTEAEWPAADIIIGNPPFLGGKRLRNDLGDSYVDTLFGVYAGAVARESDLCCYFFEQARQQIEQEQANRAGLLATNSIRGGANRDVLDRIKESGDIYMAWSDEPWILNGAAVRISIVGFDGGSETVRSLNGSPTLAINSDLTASVDVTRAARLPENAGFSFMGVTPAGPFDVPAELACQWLSLPGNPNGRTNADVVRPYYNGRDVTRRPSGRWIVEFGTSMLLDTAAMYEAPFEYVLREVKPIRSANARRSYRERWWLFAEARGAMREAFGNSSRYLATSMVSKHRFFVWLDAAVVPANLLIVFARSDDYFFGVLHSRAQEVWSLRMGTWLGKGNDPRYTPTTCFETFPLPWPPGTEPVDDPRVIAIGEAAAKLDQLRRNWLDPEGASEAELKKRTLTNLYNQRPTWLQHAHAALDRAVWAAYGWDDPDPAVVDEDTILARLLALNSERSAG